MRYAYVDCDRTLIYSLTEFPQFEAADLKRVTYNGRTFFLNEFLIEELKDFHAMGHRIVVWSAGGVEWARTVVHLAGLESIVGEVLAKPDFLFDDKQPSEWMPVTQNLDPHG